MLRFRTGDEAPHELETKLVERLRARDSSALSMLYDQYGDLIYSIARRIVKSSGDAEEVTQEVFLYAWEKADRFDPSRGSLLTWLGILARSRGIDRLRHQKSQERRKDALSLDMATEPPTRENDPHRELDLIEARQLVQEALGQLSREQREPIEIAYFEGLTQSEIADRLEKPLGTIKTRMRQGMIRLREAMMPLLAEESSR
ncbi:MAG: sigma-70 family RNA polymerase sigma factor [Candidatus Eisenbacteria bacterium]|nr:sigma-70 family RNA polymerase sigma factor [Candidatus Eisenbacteria bacterium]